MISPVQYKRAQALRKSKHWTDYVRRAYPPSLRSKVAVAWDTISQRWVLAYEKVDVMIGGGAPSSKRFLKAFYVWQGPDDTYLPAGPKMAEWLRDHDMYSEAHVGEWDDRMFGRRDRANEDRLKSLWDEVKYVHQSLAKDYTRIQSVGCDFSEEALTV